MSWRPDAGGLDPVTLEILAEQPEPIAVHLRLVNPESGARRGACSQGLGELWSGVGGEVTCPDCLEWVHG